MRLHIWVAVGLFALFVTFGAPPASAQGPNPICVGFTYNAQGNRSSQKTYGNSSQDAEWNSGRYGCFRWSAPMAAADPPAARTERLASVEGDNRVPRKKSSSRNPDP